MAIKIFYMRYITLISVAALMLSACNVQNVTDLGVLNHVTIGVAPMSIVDLPVGTKADLQFTQSGVDFRWDEDDVVGMFPDKGAQAYFEMNGFTGGATASFDGGGWALKGASKYAIYYPYSYDHRERTHIPMHYEGQRQIGKGDYSHLRKFIHLATGAQRPMGGACDYNMKRAEAVVWFRLKLPRAAVYEQLSIKLADGTKVVASTRLDISGEQYEITPDMVVNKFVVTLENIKTDRPDEVVDFYVMLPPQNFKDKKMIISIDTVDGESCQAMIDGKDMLHNNAYYYEATLTTEFGSTNESFEGIDGAWDK